MSNVNRELRCARTSSACTPAFIYRCHPVCMCLCARAGLCFCLLCEFQNASFDEETGQAVPQNNLSGFPLGRYKHRHLCTHFQLLSACRRRMKTFLSASLRIWQVRCVFAEVIQRCDMSQRWAFTGGASRMCAHFCNPASGAIDEAKSTVSLCRSECARVHHSHWTAGFLCDFLRDSLITRLTVEAMWHKHACAYETNLGRTAGR